MSRTLAIESNTPSTRQTAVNDESVKDLVQRRAYQLFEERGRVDGHDQEDWARAEKEILAIDEPRKVA